MLLNYSSLSSIRDSADILLNRYPCLLRPKTIHLPNWEDKAGSLGMYPAKIGLNYETILHSRSIAPTRHPKPGLEYSLTIPANMILAPLRAVFALLCTFHCALGVSIPGFGHSHDARQYQENDKLGAVASESSVCSRIGVDLIKAGGTAADALVGTIFCVGVIGMGRFAPSRLNETDIFTGMYHSGIGGGGFMLGRFDNCSHEDTTDSVDMKSAHPMAHMNSSISARQRLQRRFRTCTIVMST